jgi:crotonobetainyl-CoA:carnitine CoA-transferase CaiB-like acyl-CoA transferase
LFAAPGALAAVLQSLDTGRGAHIDVSMHDVLAIAGSNHLHLMHELRGRPDVNGPARMLDTPSIEVASDGLVAFNTNAGHMFQMFLLLIGRPDLMGDATYASLTSRLAMGEAWQQVIDDHVGKHTVAEILAEAEGLRVPVAPVHDGSSVLQDEHLVARGVFVEADDGGMRPRPPYLIDGEQMAVAQHAPRIGEHDATVTAREPRTPHVDAGEPRGLPLAGVRVVDLTSWWVGALATQTLAMLGADVIHIEGVAHPDGMRLTGASFAKSDDWWEWGHMFAAANTTKRGIAIDLGTPDGRDILDRLIDWADVLVENFSPRVAEGWGLTGEAVLARNPRIVYQRMPAYGLTGPWRDRPAFAQTIEPMSTMASITGYPDALPVSKGGLPDPNGGMHGAWSLLVSLAEARRRGTGVFCEAVMIEAALNVCAQPALECSMWGEVMTRAGNRAAHAAPQGVYACRGADAWVAISVVDDAQWRTLATIIGGTALAGDPRYASHASRRAKHDELDDLIARWCASREPAAAADLLARAGVPAAACRNHLLIDAHPQYEARRLFAPVTHPVLGTYHTPGLPYRWDGVDRWVGDAAPTFGQHNREVLHDVVGLDDDAINTLDERGVIAARPHGL